MLKALELVGFKSFADRTRFDFPEGITAVVGPNGSGKSNVVDAVKWVLGAHSARAIRGAEMTDVIFKGSAEGGRKPANSAEVVLVLDNRSRLLTFDSDEVHVCRRVYRSGEGDYTINGRPCRLKDVRDLFRGTGVGVDSYSLIEQGKVDRLLQSSAKDRRAIFEEAAGISRFKAKKVEAERRLARVDQNMLRIRDIVDELGKRLSTLKQQASKAQRYREWSVQSIQKRTELGLLDLKDLDSQQRAIEKRQADAVASRDQVRRQVDEKEQSLEEQQRLLRNTADALASLEKELAKCQRDHVQASGERNLNEQRQQEWSNERTNLLERIDALERRVTVGEEEILERKRILAQHESERDLARVRASELESTVQLLEQALLVARSKGDAAREKQDSARQQLAKLRADASSQFQSLESIETELLRIGQKIEDRSASIERLQSELRDRQQEWDGSRKEYSASESSKELARKHYDESVDHQRKQQQVCLELQTRIQGLEERLTLLSQLEEQFTNAGRGGQPFVRSAMELTKSHALFSSRPSPLRGIVADLIRTDLHLAPLVDVALGPYADAIVLSDGQLIDWVQEGRLVPEGRVTLLRLDRLPTRRTGERIQLDGLRGVLGRADRLVRFEPVDEPLVRTLLGTTWFVESLATALDLSHFRGAGLRFVTAECQLIDSDGSITLGSLQTGLGLVSRRSEMQAAAEQRDAIRASLDNARSILESMENAQQAASEQVHRSDLAVVAAARNMASAEQKMNATRETLQAELHALQALRTEQFSKTEQRNQLDQSMILLDQQRIELEDIESQMVSEVEQMVRNVRQQEAECRQAQQILVEHRIESARQEQRLDGLQVTLQQLLQDASERNHYLKTAREEWQSLEEKLSEAIAKHGDLAIRIQDIERRSHELEQNRLDLHIEHETQQRLVHDTRKQIDQWMRQIEKIDDSHGALTDEQERIAQQRREILARYRDEYQIDLLAGSESNSPSELSSREEIEAELARLRSEIASAGSVNMEALEELEALQTRYDKLANQEQDLLDAKAGLLRTMHKIDEDSRLVFRETLEAIRANFQQLYRKSFGGGSADIILENPDDPESGIEIVATPPGKTTFSNSLLSGGEKALTAVSLIMAFFQHRPSPFCILDEVDAPFDEANIGRFVAVLDEFLASTKFIIVTHSKKTMTVANMIYGVTMQESGVSRQVAVKFEEVDDRGEIVRRAA